MEGRQSNQLFLLRSAGLVINRLWLWSGAEEPDAQVSLSCFSSAFLTASSPAVATVALGELLLIDELPQHPSHTR